MASNYNRKSTSLDSRKPTSRSRGANGGSVRSSRPSSASSRSAHSRFPSGQDSYTAIPGGRSSGYKTAQSREPLTSVRVGDIGRAERAQRLQKKNRRFLIVFALIATLVTSLFVGGVALYNSDTFTIESISVTGVEHLTTDDLQNLAGIPSGTTLLTVDIADIESNLLKNAWIEDVTINRIFPNTLEIVVTERVISAVVEVYTSTGDSVQDWAIASDGMWLMPIPEEGSEAAQTTSAQIYEDAASVLRITDVPYGTSPEIGEYCTDDNVNNALNIVSGMTTELADRVVAVKAEEAESTTLTIEDGPDIVFGTAENIREKELVCLEIMEMYPDGVSYINVRDVDNPTWRTT